jgi:hypothetical protein
MGKYILPVLLNGVLRGTATIVVNDLGNLITIEFEYSNIKIQKQGEKPFYVLKQIRKYLDTLNIKIVCKGSLMNVYPSGMSSVGFKAYELQMGKPSTDMVNIFEETSRLELIATVEEQDFFYAKWIKSLQE